MTLLMTAAKAAYEARVNSRELMPGHRWADWEDLPEEDQARMRLEVLYALIALTSVPKAMVNKMGVMMLSGPQPDDGGRIVYPAAMWRAGLKFIIEEQDNERDDAESPTREAEGGRAEGFLQEHPGAVRAEPSGEAPTGDEGEEELPPDLQEA